MSSAYDGVVGGRLNLKGFGDVTEKHRLEKKEKKQKRRKERKKANKKSKEAKKRDSEKRRRHRRSRSDDDSDSGSDNGSDSESLSDHSDQRDHRRKRTRRSKHQRRDRDSKSDGDSESDNESRSSDDSNARKSSKKKKSHKERSKKRRRRSRSTSSVSPPRELETVHQKDDTIVEDKEDLGKDVGDDDNDSLADMTPAERRFELKRREREAAKIKEMTSMTHRERVEAFNEKLSKLSEHHDIPKVSAAGNG